MASGVLNLSFFLFMKKNIKRGRNATSRASTEHLEEAAEIWHDVVCVVAVDEALPAVVNEPAVDVGAVPRVAPVVLLPAPNARTHTLFGLKTSAFLQHLVTCELKCTW